MLAGIIGEQFLESSAFKVMERISGRSRGRYLVVSSGSPIPSASGASWPGSDICFAYGVVGGGVVVGYNLTITQDAIINLGARFI